MPPMTYRPKGAYCVVIPALNAARTIGELIRRIRRQGIEVIVVDDGSSDRTAALAAEQHALVISHLRTKGRAAALRTALEHVMRSAYDGVITMDSEGRYDPADIITLIQAGELQHAGMVLGNRLADRSARPDQSSGTPGWASALISAIAHQPIPDIGCELRLIRKEVLTDAAARANRFEQAPALLRHAVARRWKIISVPVRDLRGGSRGLLGPFSEAWGALSFLRGLVG